MFWPNYYPKMRFFAVTLDPVEPKNLWPLLATIGLLAVLALSQFQKALFRRTFPREKRPNRYPRIIDETHPSRNHPFIKVARINTEAQKPTFKTTTMEKKLKTLFAFAFVLWAALITYLITTLMP